MIWISRQDAEYKSEAKAKQVVIRWLERSKILLCLSLDSQTVHHSGLLYRSWTFQWQRPIHERKAKGSFAESQWFFYSLIDKNENSFLHKSLGHLFHFSPALIQQRSRVGQSQSPEEPEKLSPWSVEIWWVTTWWISATNWRDSCSRIKGNWMIVCDYNLAFITMSLKTRDAVIAVF